MPRTAKTDTPTARKTRRVKKPYAPKVMKFADMDHAYEVTRMLARQGHKELALVQTLANGRRSKPIIAVGDITEVNGEGMKFYLDNGLVGKAE